MAAFLGIAEDDAEMKWGRPAGTYLGQLEHDGRRVVFARALNGPVSGEYIDAVRALVHRPFGSLG